MSEKWCGHVLRVWPLVLLIRIQWLVDKLLFLACVLLVLWKLTSFSRLYLKKSPAIHTHPSQKQKNRHGYKSSTISRLEILICLGFLCAVMTNQTTQH